MSSSVFDVAIVGAGIVGAACADECVREGMSVVVIESDIVGGGATAAGMGHIVVMDDSEAQFALTSYSQNLWRELAPELPGDVEYDACGTIWVAADEEEMEEVRRKQLFYSERNVKVEVLDAGALLNAEPKLRRGLAGGLRVPGDAVIYAPAAARFMLERATARGAVLRSGCPVVELTDEGVRLSNGAFIASGMTINATGTWSPSLTPGIDVRKRKGHLLITDRYPNFLRHQVVELGYLKSAHSLTSDSVAFNVQPRRTGQLLIGSSRQFDSEDSKVDAVMLARMLARAKEYIPELGRLSAIRAWAGFRAATTDKLPLIGPSPVHSRQYLATGHEGLGITTSLGTARLVVDQLLKRPSQIAIGPFLPARPAQEAVYA